MTHYETRALEVLLAHEKTTEPFGGPVEAVGVALGLPSAEARTPVKRMAMNGLVKIRMQGSNFEEVGHIVLGTTWWEKGPKAE